MTTTASPIISYAQNREDVLINRVFQNQATGFYVDVGANDPAFYSVTKAFYDHGWRGINIEPGTIFELLKAERPRDINLNVAISEHAGPATFYVCPDAPGLSSLCPDVPDTIRPHVGGRYAKTVDAVPLRDVFRQAWPETGVDFMSIDVEGYERSVILSNDWSRYRPRLVLLEATLPGSSIPCHMDWEPLLLKADYLFAYFDGLNRFYLRKEDEALMQHFRVPVNLFDGYQIGETAEWQGRAKVAEAAQAHLESLLEGTGYRAQKIGLWIARFLSRFIGGISRNRAALASKPAAPSGRFEKQHQAHALGIEQTHKKISHNPSTGQAIGTTIGKT